MVVALLALFVAVGGSAVAVTAKIDGKLLKNRSVAGKKLKRNTLGGAQIAEGRLGRVPRAGEATSAGTANFAQTAGSAQTATSATTAETAAKATSADDASTLSGLSVGDLVRGSSSTVGGCNPDFTDLFPTVCRTVTISNPRVGKVLVLATGTWFGAAGANGTCTLRRGTDAFGTPGQETELGQATATHTSEATGAAFSLAGIFGLVPAGDQGFAVTCEELAAPNIQFANMRITAVRLTEPPPVLALP
jgi:hypothetical protein